MGCLERSRTSDSGSDRSVRPIHTFLGKEHWEHQKKKVSEFSSQMTLCNFAMMSVKHSVAHRFQIGEIIKTNIEKNR